jgi:protocatechuate 3,4-dioxygenase beta subunit
VFSLIFAFSLSCHGEAMAVETSLLKGKVTDFEGKPVEDAVIFIYQSANTRRQPDFVSPNQTGRPIQHCSSAG